MKSKMAVARTLEINVPQGLAHDIFDTNNPMLYRAKLPNPPPMKTAKSFMNALFDSDGSSDKLVLNAPHDVTDECAEERATKYIEGEMHAQVHAAVADEGAPSQQGPQPCAAPE